MWVFTTDGFLSAVEERDGNHRGEIVVRAREAAALEALGEIAPTLGHRKVPLRLSAYPER